MKKAIFALSVLALAGCAATAPNEAQTVATPNVHTFGSAGSEHAIELHYINKQVSPQFQEYSVTLNVGPGKQVIKFDLCNDLAEQASCPSTVIVKPIHDGQLWVDYLVNFPIRVKDQQHNEIVTYKSKADEAEVEGLLLMDQQVIQNRAFGHWGEELGKATTEVYGKDFPEPLVVKEFTITAK